MSEQRPNAPPSFDWRAITPEDSPKTPMDVHDDPARQPLYQPDVQVGDIAYDFSSPVYDYSDGTERATGETFELLRAAREKPVALIFGSYT